LYRTRHWFVVFAVSLVIGHLSLVIGHSSFVLPFTTDLQPELI
jgi:hypothetical protein